MASLILRRPAWCLELSRSAAAPSLVSASIRPYQLHSTSQSAPPLQFPPSIRQFSTSLLRRAAPTPPSIQNVVNPPPQTDRTVNNPPTTPRSTAPASTSATKPPITVLTSGLSDDPPVSLESDPSTDWTRSFKGLSSEPFSDEAAKILMERIPENDVEIKPDGILYLPEIKYRRILNRAFGPGGWGLAPRGESMVTLKAVTREYALVAHGRLVSIARGEQDYFSPEGIPTAAEGCKSNAMMRCCKDLGVASELWDPRWIREFKRKNAKEMFVEHVVNKKKTKIWIRKDDDVKYPWKESKPSFGA